jgi:hypothetical protein
VLTAAHQTVRQRQDVAHEVPAGTIVL